jgi:hypothetical protein
MSILLLGGDFKATLKELSCFVGADLKVAVSIDPVQNTAQ